MSRSIEWRNLTAVALLAACTVACSDGPTGPADDALDAPAGLTTDLEVEVAGDAEAAEVAVQDAALDAGSTSDEEPADGPFAEARERFRQAREALAAGDTAEARRLATEARRLLVEILIERRGEPVVDGLFGRVESLVERLEEASDEYDRVDELEDRLESLLVEAYVLQGAGDLVGAGERLVLALQIADRLRYRHRDFRLDPIGRARLAIARAGEAVELAEGLTGPDPTPLQERFLFHARELLRLARFAADHGGWRRAMAYAHRAETRSLCALLECERPTVEEALWLLDVAERQIAAARDAVGGSPGAAQAAILQRAERLKTAGAAAIDAWRWRGVGLLWRAAVLAGTLF